MANQSHGRTKEPCPGQWKRYKKAVFRATAMESRSQALPESRGNMFSELLTTYNNIKFCNPEEYILTKCSFNLMLKGIYNKTNKFITFFFVQQKKLHLHYYEFY